METKKCLVVDDEPVILAVVSDTLNQRGYQVVTAADGETALRILASTTFDIMLTDIMMPGISGIELTKRVKMLYEEMPIIVVTGFVEDYSYDEVIAAGAADFIKKPFSILELETRMTRVMRDATFLALMRKKGKELENASTLMIAGLQEEAYHKVMTLEREVKQLKDEIVGGRKD